MPKILCVDDEPLNLTLLEAILSPRGYDVVTAMNGRAALEKIRTERIDICLLDVMMPEMDGFEVCRRIKSDENHDNIPVIMITALVDKESRIRGIVAGAEDFISKPFDANEVLARIKMLLRVEALNHRLNAAYNNIAKMSAFGEEMITGFDPATFDFMEKMDSIVSQIIKRKIDLIDTPEIVVIGMIDHSGISQWLRYDSKESGIERSVLAMDFDHGHTFSDSGKAEVYYYNESGDGPAASELVGELKKLLCKVSNVVSYSNDSFCLIALNYDRDVTSYDATVLNSVVMQSLFLRSLTAQVRDTESAFEYTVLALARASEVNDEDTGDHILRVGNYCALLSGQLKMPDRFVQAIRIQGTLHDVGKIHVSPVTLKKPDTLTGDEWLEMKMHTVHGLKIIGDHNRMSMAARIAISHHERYDGSGYPYGLSGEQIPIEGRILSLADQYDAMRNVRCYKPAFDHATTCRIILEGDGPRTLPQHFDPDVLAAFGEIHERFAEVFETGGCS